MRTNEPAFNMEIEQQVLGLLIKHPLESQSRETLDSVDINDFYTLVHRRIYSCLKSMSERKKDITMPLLSDELDKIGDDYGGLIYLAELMRHAIGIDSLGSYVGVVKQCAKLRDLDLLLGNASEMISRRVDTDEIFTSLDTNLKALSVSSNGKELRHIKDLEGNFLDELDERAKRGGAIAGLSTGIPELDERINGVGNESLVVVAGSPSMGKTLFCQTLATNIGVDQQKNTMFFSMEMSESSLFERFVSGIGNVSPAALKSARLNNEELGRIEKAVRLLRVSKIFLTDEPKQSVGQIRAKVRRHKINNPDLSAIFIDYLGLMKLGKADRHDIAIGDITRDLKELCKEVKVPIFLCVQSKRPQNIKDRPNMASLKDSSCIEADADLIMFVHRQEIIEPETDLKGVTELIIAKDRHNDGNGTLYMEKVNGSFIAMGKEQAGMVEHRAQVEKNPPKKAKGYRKDD